MQPLYATAYGNGYATDCLVTYPVMQPLMEMVCNRLWKVSPQFPSDRRAQSQVVIAFDSIRDLPFPAVYKFVYSDSTVGAIVRQLVEVRRGDCFCVLPSLMETVAAQSGGTVCVAVLPP
jgi:hypothetical protein